MAGGKAGKPKGTRDFNPKTKTKIRAMYETGEYATVEDLRQAISKKWRRCPSLHTIQIWSCREKWDKFRHQKALAEQLNKNYDVLFAEQGLGDPQLVKEVTKLIKKRSTKVTGLIMAFKLKGAGAYGTTRMKLTMPADEDPRSMNQDERRKVFEDIARGFTVRNQ
jgi:hypothetical protein